MVTGLSERERKRLRRIATLGVVICGAAAVLVLFVVFGRGFLNGFVFAGQTVGAAVFVSAFYTLRYDAEVGHYLPTRKTWPVLIASAAMFVAGAVLTGSLGSDLAKPFGGVYGGSLEITMLGSIVAAAVIVWIVIYNTVIKPRRRV